MIHRVSMALVVPMLVSLLAASPALASTVGLSAADGVRLSAESYGKGERGVLLLHDAGRSRADWAFFAEKLSSAGYLVLSLDLRGHGASEAVDLTDESWPLMVQDAQAGVSWLREHGATSVSIVGAHLGANLALNTASADASVDDLILLSPGLNVNGVKMSAAIDAYGTRRVLFVASTEDSSGARAAQALGDRAQGIHEVELIDGSGVGTRLLNRSAELESMMVTWLAGPTEDDVTQSGQRRLGTGSITEIETSGQRFGE